MNQFRTQFYYAFFLSTLLSQTTNVFSTRSTNRYQEICDYYETITTENKSQFQHDCTKICDQAIKDIESKLSSPNENKIYAFIFDIDETSLSNYPFCKERKFETKHGQSDDYRMQGICPAIKPVLLLHQFLRNNKCFMVFISSRHEKLTEVTRRNLEEQGYHVDEIYLMPAEPYKRRDPVGPWKESVRKEISNRFEIIGNIGDSETDFVGEYNGMKIKLPNRLY